MIMFFLWRGKFPYGDTPRTFLCIDFNSKHINFIPNNSMSFQMIIVHSKKHSSFHGFVGLLSKECVKSCCYICYCVSSFSICVCLFATVYKDPRNLELLPYL